jgi:hypothetical protein
MRETLQKAVKKLCRRLPSSIAFGSLRKFSKLQPFEEKNHHPLECGILGTLQQKQGLKREYIYYISITYSKAAKLGTLRWHPSRLGTLRKLGIFPRRMPNCRRLPSSLTPPHPSRKKFSRHTVAPARPGSPAREALPPSSSPKALATVSVPVADIHQNEPVGTCTKKGKRQTERFTHCRKRGTSIMSNEDQHE